MRGQIGSWDGELSVGFSDEMVDWLDCYGCNRYVTVGALRIDVYADLESKKRVQLTRAITVSPSNHRDGFRVSVRPNNGLKHGIALRHELVPGIEALELPRCELHEVEFVTDGLNDSITGFIGPDHELPWPKLRKCPAYATSEVLEADLKKRMVSYLRAGRPGQFLRPSQLQMDRMEPGAWKRVMDESLAEVG